jgi:ABC-type phosphate transport system auxiliary subunit
MSIFDMYRAKKKRAVDPNAPPRPNLLSHEKVLKDTKVTLGQLQQENQQLRSRIDALESKFTHQTAYLNQLHQVVTKLTKKG